MNSEICISVLLLILMNQNSLDNNIDTKYKINFDDFIINQFDEYEETTFVSSDNSLCISSTESEENESVETTYTLQGKIVKPTIFKEKIWWIVDIYDPNELKKINKPGFMGISGMFLYEPVSDLKNPINYLHFKHDQTVKVNITYNDRGYCMYMKNIIDI